MSKRTFNLFVLLISFILIVLATGCEQTIENIPERETQCPEIGEYYTIRSPRNNKLIHRVYIVNVEDGNIIFYNTSQHWESYERVHTITCRDFYRGSKVIKRQ